MQRFREEKIVSKEMTVLHPGQILRHPSNRAGFMINGFKTFNMCTLFRSTLGDRSFNAEVA